jgi:hypothetical protein
MKPPEADSFDWAAYGNLQVELSERYIAARMKVTGRQCGACSMCCRLLDVPEVGKPDHEWCPHCRPGHGCQIYDNRPGKCRGYSCVWLTESKFGEEWFPARSKIVPDLHTGKDGHIFLRFIVDPQYPNRWREAPYYSQIKQLALRGLHGELLLGGTRCLTVVSIRGKWTLILPNKEIEYRSGVVVPVSDDQFELLPCKTDEQVTQLKEFLHATRRAGARARRAYPEIAHENPLALLNVIAADPEIIALLEKYTARR